MLRFNSFPRVRPVDSGPALDTALSDVPGCVDVGRLSEAARRTEVGGLVGAAGLVDRPARRAHLRRVGGIDVDHRDACAFGLVGHERSELMEGPGVQRDPLGLAKPNSPADAFEVFEGDAAMSALSLGHDALADAVVDAPSEAPLLATPMLEQPLGGLGTLSLELGSQVSAAMSHPVEMRARVPSALASGGDVGDAEINTDEGFWVEGLVFHHVNGHVKIPATIAVDEVRFPLPRGKEFALASPAYERDALPTSGRPDRHCVGEIAEDAIVVGQRSEGA